MSLVQVKCQFMNCGVLFLAEQKEINRGFGKFCSQRCANIQRVLNLVPPEPNVKCALCGTNFYLCSSKQDNSKSGLFFCCRAHKDEAQRVGGIKEIMPAHYGVVSENTYRRIAFAAKPKVCERCGYDKHEAGIIVHHRDRNRDNNDISNLEVLCAICHAIEHHNE